MNGCEVSFEAERLAMVKCAENKYLDVSVKTKDSIENNDNSSFISVNINSGVLDHNRRWPKEYYSVLIRELVKNPNTVVLLIGGRGDVDYVSGLEEFLNIKIPDQGLTETPVVNLPQDNVMVLVFRGFPIAL